MTMLTLKFNKISGLSDYSSSHKLCSFILRTQAEDCGEGLIGFICSERQEAGNCTCVGNIILRISIKTIKEYIMDFCFPDPDEFTITIEVVPPSGNDPEPLLKKLTKLSKLNFHAFSVASNPVAKPKMSAMVFSHLIQQRCNKKAILHFTVRDHNLLGLQSELWGAKALGIDTVIALSGDPSSSRPDNPISTVRDTDVFGLTSLASESDMNTGVVLDYRPEIDGLGHEAKRLIKKVEAGAKFIVTQPVYDNNTAKKIQLATKDLNVPVIMGILPLLSYKHALFLHDKVAGIAVPENLQKEMKESANPVETGIVQSRQMLDMAKEMFSGACVMPPFDRFDILEQIL